MVDEFAMVLEDLVTDKKGNVIWTKIKFDDRKASTPDSDDNLRMINHINKTRAHRGVTRSKRK